MELQVSASKTSGSVCVESMITAVRQQSRNDKVLWFHRNDKEATETECLWLTGHCCWALYVIQTLERRKGSKVDRASLVYRNLRCLVLWDPEAVVRSTLLSLELRLATCNHIWEFSRDSYGGCSSPHLKRTRQKFISSWTGNRKTKWQLCKLWRNCTDQRMWNSWCDVDRCG